MSDRINRSVPIHEISSYEVAPGVVARRFMMSGCGILVSHDPTEDGYLWHLSISRKDRDPSWNEIVTARYRILPEVEEMAMYFPPLGEYVNVHPFTFHLHEVKKSRIILAR